MKEALAQIHAPHFTAGVVLRDDKVIKAAPIVHYMQRGKRTCDRVREGWHIMLVYDNGLHDP